MDAQEMVRTRYPKAEARQHAAIYGDGGDGLTRPGYWVISPGGQGTRTLGRGATEAEAWHRAAMAVKAEE